MHLVKATLLFTFAVCQVIIEPPLQAQMPNTFSNSIEMQFVLIPKGEFIMGSPKEEVDRDSGENQHQVVISQPFYMSKTEVTRRQFSKFIDATGYKTEAESKGSKGYDATNKTLEDSSKYTWRDPGFPQTDDHPVVCISWNDGAAFVKWLNKSNAESGRFYRMPTSAQWEYACRGGAGTAFVTGNDSEQLATVANIADASTHWSWSIRANDGFEFTSPVGSFTSNKFGLQDMHGNVWEWCQDGYRKYDNTKVSDPLGLTSSNLRIYRGGGWGSGAKLCRSAVFKEGDDSFSSCYVGLRLVVIPSDSMSALDNEIVIDSLLADGEESKAKGEVAKATRLLRQASEKSEKELGVDHAKTAECNSLLGVTYYKQADYTNALPCFQKAYKIRSKTLGPENLLTGVSLQNLAQTFRKQENYAEALPLFQQLIRVREIAQGANHKDTAECLNLFGGCYYEQGNYDEALPLFKRALKIQENVLGLQHPDTAITIHNLALCYREQSNYAEALPLFKRMLNIREKELGPEHVETQKIRVEIGAALLSQKNYAEALPLYQRVLAISEKTQGPDHPETSIYIHLLGVCYYEQADYKNAQQHFLRAIKIQEKTLGPDHLETAKSIHNLASVYEQLGKHAEALPLRQRVAKLDEIANGRDSLESAESLRNLGNLYKSQGNNDAAIPIFQRIVNIFERARGANHPETLENLDVLADTFKDQGKLAEAYAIYRKVLTIREQVLGPDDRKTAKSLDAVAGVCQSQANYAEALSLYQRSHNTWEKFYGVDHPKTALSLNNLAGAYKSLANYADALPLYERALKITETSLSPDHPDTATILSDMADLYVSQGNYSEALPLYKRAVDIREKSFGSENAKTADSLNGLAELYREQGDIVAALPLHERALSIREKTLGPEHTKTSNSLNNLGICYYKKGNFEKARMLYQRALEIDERNLGLDHPQTAKILNNLADLYIAQDNYVEAMPLFQRALKINEKTLGSDHPDTIPMIFNLAHLYRLQGNYTEAINLSQKALRISEKALGPDDPHTAQCLCSLAKNYLRLSNFSDATRLTQRALTLFEKAHGPEHPTVAHSVHELATIYLAQADYAQAIPLFQRSLKIIEGAYGLQHSAIAYELNSLAFAYSLNGQVAEAISPYQQVIKVREELEIVDHVNDAEIYSNLGIALEVNGSNGAIEAFDRSIRSVFAHCRNNLRGMSEKEQELFLRKTLNNKLTVALTQAVRHPQDAARMACWPLNSKGIIQDVSSAQELAKRDIKDPKVAKLAMELEDSRRKLAEIAMNAANASEQSKRHEMIDRLSTDVDRLSRELAQATGSRIASGGWIDCDSLRNAMPKDSAFVDIVRFGVFDFEARKLLYKTKPAHYAAWITPATGNGEIRMVDLGLASEIDALIEPIRTALGPGAMSGINAQGEENATKTLNALLQKLADRIWKPIQPFIGNSRQIILSPDGALWLVPWTALPVDSNDQLMIEKYSLRLVTSGREILNPKTTERGVNPPLIFADPNFDSSSGEKKKSIEAVLKTTPTADDVTLRSLSAKSLLPKAMRLPNTASEAKFIQPNIEKLTGSKATLYESQYALESIAKKASRPKVAVFATHGFFLPAQNVKQEARSGLSFGNESHSIVLDTQGKPIENPLLRCGLLFAGCNNRDAVVGDDDGILTGLEIVGIDFRGTDLVVLSACETGVGDIKSGEGVAGLRQAFQLAGAKAVVASLWQVPDRDSAIIMNDFFAEVATGSTATEAMRKSQLKRIESRRQRFGAAHPIFWAAWTVTE